VGEQVLIFLFLSTGANDTTGLETARALHLTGAKIFITTRSATKSAAAIKTIIDSNGGERGGIEAITMELGDLSSVRHAAKEFLSRSDKLNILTCNAGGFHPFLDISHISLEAEP
jgi:NAD(P)-dependent dehydrogenase (short-subunit alcohol dehydrogenase family)